MTSMHVDRDLAAIREVGPRTPQQLASEKHRVAAFSDEEHGQTLGEPNQLRRQEQVELLAMNFPST